MEVGSDEREVWGAAHPKTRRSRGTSLRRQRLKSVGRIFFDARSPSAPNTTTDASSPGGTGEMCARASSPASDLDSSESELSSDLDFGTDGGFRARAAHDAEKVMKAGRSQKEFYNQTPSHNTGHGTGAHWD